MGPLYLKSLPTCSLIQLEGNVATKQHEEGLAIYLYTGLTNPLALGNTGALANWPRSEAKAIAMSAILNPP
jgi:hypothetical protein